MADYENSLACSLLVLFTFLNGETDRSRSREGATRSSRYEHVDIYPDRDPLVRATAV